MSTYKYEFSVITAVYDVEDYLREAVESLINQTIGFEHIQLIMVDDGSTDKCGSICDEYAKMYPENVITIHKENGRQASARNAGISYAKGKYVTFMDPDDTLSSDTMELVKTFMDGEGQKADMCCIPMYFFGDREGDHPLNNKFLEGTMMVNLLESDRMEYVVLSTSSSFFRLETARKMEFDTEMYHAEDAKEVIKVLVNNPNLGLISEARYNYRKHGQSTLGDARQHENSYLPIIRRFYRWSMEYAEEKYGYVPRFVQYTVMYDLNSKLAQRELPLDVLTDNQAEEYKKELFETATMIDDDIILQQTIDAGIKLFILGKKYNKPPKLKLIRSKKERLYSAGEGNLCNGDGEKTDITLSYNNQKVTAVSDMHMVWQFIDINAAKKECTIEGQFTICGLDRYYVEPIVVADGITYDCKTFRIEEWDGLCVGETVSYRLGFKATIPLKETTHIYAALTVKDVQVINKHVHFGYFFPVADIYSNAYAFISGYMVMADRNYICVSGNTGICGRFIRECRFLTEIWNKNLLGGRKAVVGRIVYHLVKPHLKKQIWIISDRITKADDNGEALFRYLQDHKPEGVCVVFAIGKESKDYLRIRSIGSCVNSMSFSHKMLHLLCDVNISSGAERVIINPFDCYSDALRDLLMNKKFIFLQHGVLGNDGSRWLKKYHKNITGFVTSSEKERDSIVNGQYHYDNDAVWLTGLPRYDRLYHAESKKITVMPTWRRSLVDKYDTKTGVWKKIKDFENTDYYKFYDGLLNSERLADVLEEYGYTLQFFPHPNIRGYLDDFHHNGKVRYLSTETLYRDVYAESELIITDYSSAVFDFSYLRKPIIYCQFDKDEFFSGGHTMAKGYFDYEDDGFGEVVYDLDSTIDIVIDYVKNGCRLKEQYRKRIDSFFAYDDQNNCRRVVEHILELCGES